MESIKFKNKYIDTEGIYDSNEGETQDKINSDLQFVDKLDMRFPLLSMCDVGYGSIQGLCVVDNRYIVVGRHLDNGSRDLMVFDVLDRKVKQSNIFTPPEDDAETSGTNVYLGHLGSMCFVESNGNKYIYIPRKEKSDIIRLIVNDDFTITYDSTQYEVGSNPKINAIAYNNSEFYYLEATTKQNKCFVRKSSDYFSSTSAAFSTTLDGFSAVNLTRQGLAFDGKYLYFSVSNSSFNISDSPSAGSSYDWQKLIRTTQNIIITDTQGNIIKGFSFPRCDYGEIEDIDLITLPGSNTLSIVIACNENDSHLSTVYICPLYRNSVKSWYSITQTSEMSSYMDYQENKIYKVYCDSRPCYTVNDVYNANNTYNVLNSNPFAIGLVQDKFTSIPAAIGYIKKLGFPVTLYISGKHGNMTYRGLRGINFVFDGENTEVGDITIEDSYGISLSFVNGATHGTIDTKNSVLYGDYEKVNNAVNAITSHGEVELSLDLIAGSCWNLEGNTAVLGSNANWSIVGSSDGIPVQEGEEYTITACQGNTAKTRIWAVTDDSFNILEKAPDFQNDQNKKSSSFCRIPAGGTKLLVTGRISFVEAPAITISKISEQFMTEYGEPIPVEFTIGGLKSGTYLASDRNDRIRVIGRSLPLIQAGSIIRVKYPYSAAIYASKSARYADSVVYVATWLTSDFIVPEEYNGYYWGAVLRKIGHESDDISADIDIISDYIQFIPKLSAYEIARRKLLSGKKLSVMGDSMSAMAGYIPSTFPSNAAYYHGSDKDVFSAKQMWWSVLCKLTGMTPLVINAYSGSGVTQLEDDRHSDRTPMSDDSRCNGLGTSNDEPDVIIIAGGTNDYSYSQSAKSEPLSWDGKTTPVLGNSFTEAYACMIKKIRDNYPNAIIVCLSTWFTVGGTFNGYTYTHTSVNTNNDYTQADYDAAIENVCKQMRVPYINVNNVGFNAATHYGQYASDSQETPTHLNARGHYVIGKCIAEKIIPLVIGLKNNDYFKYTTS